MKKHGLVMGNKKSGGSSKKPNSKEEKEI